MYYPGVKVGEEPYKTGEGGTCTDCDKSRGYRCDSETQLCIADLEQDDQQSNTFFSTKGDVIMLPLDNKLVIAGLMGIIIMVVFNLYCFCHRFICSRCANNSRKTIEVWDTETKRMKVPTSDDCSDSDYI